MRPLRNPIFCVYSTLIHRELLCACGWVRCVRGRTPNCGKLTPCAAPARVRAAVCLHPSTKGVAPLCGCAGLEAPCEPGADPEFDEYCASPCSTAAPPNPSTCSVPLSWMYDPRRATARIRVPAPASRPVPPGAAPRRRSLGIKQRRVGPERRGGTVGGFCSRKHQANQARAKPVFAAAVTAAPPSAPRRRVRGVLGQPTPAGSRRVPSRPPVASDPRVARQPRRQVRAPASAKSA